CCRRLLAELARVMQLRGAAILLHDGSVECHGELRMDDIARVWPRDGGGLPRGTLTVATFRELPRPLADALTAADALVAVPTAPENAEHAGVILEELTRVERQVRDLLRFARREDYCFEPVDLVALVDATTVQLRSRCDRLGVRLAVAVPERALVRGDPEKLR